jgi:hypothetical protein
MENPALHTFHSAPQAIFDHGVEQLQKGELAQALQTFEEAELVGRNEGCSSLVTWSLIQQSLALSMLGKVAFLSLEFCFFCCSCYRFRSWWRC